MKVWLKRAKPHRQIHGVEIPRRSCRLRWASPFTTYAVEAGPRERLVPGGMIVYDDYGWDTTPGIARYVNSQLQLKDRIVLHNLNGHAIVIKR